MQRIQEGLVTSHNGVDMGWTIADKVVYWSNDQRKASVTNEDLFETLRW